MDTHIVDITAHTEVIMEEDIMGLMGVGIMMGLAPVQVHAPVQAQAHIGKV
jgi:hypothetical protein